MNRETVKSVLEQEVPELRAGDTIGVVCGLILSLSLITFASMGLYGYLLPTGPKVGFLLVPLIGLGLSFAVGSQLHGSTDVYGADIADEGAQRYSDAWTGWGRDRGMEQMQFGMALMAFQFVMCGAYESYRYLREKDQHASGSNSGEIASYMVHQVMLKARANQDELLGLPALHGYPEPELKQTLALLNRKGIFDLSPQGFSIAPPKKYLFD